MATVYNSTCLHKLFQPGTFTCYMYSSACVQSIFCSPPPSHGRGRFTVAVVTMVSDRPSGDQLSRGREREREGIWYASSHQLKGDLFICL